ncbi:hypothetical protein MTR67_047472 [Solanum verrucosum]|uniref:Uncharacterized protein n=1 Tax=Solanum verrucosum TaxID=315347 RepID=A0AAF0UX58_SOLVR|nr:hypothetical protein MTR67_047472 [Solanum verrucosum]
MRGNHNWIRRGLEKKRSNFKFENWWLKVEGFTDLIQAWWNEFLVEGCPNYRLNVKLRMLKEKLKEWRNANFGKLVNKKNSLLEELAEIDELQGARDLTEDEMKDGLEGGPLSAPSCKLGRWESSASIRNFLGTRMITAMHWCGILNEEKRKGKEEKSEQDQGKEPVVVLQEYEEVFMEPKELPPFIWQFDHITLKERSAATSSKKALTSASVLTLTDFSLVFTMKTDAYDVDIGTVPMQKGQAIAYLS